MSHKLQQASLFTTDMLHQFGMPALLVIQDKDEDMSFHLCDGMTVENLKLIRKKLKYCIEELKQNSRG